MRELGGGFGDCVERRGTTAWGARMRAWMRGSEEPAHLAARALRDYRAVTWEESARALFDAALSAERRT